MGSYKFGLYFNQSFNVISFGIGLVLDKQEKYLYINFLFWELAIGRTGR